MVVCQLDVAVEDCKQKEHEEKEFLCEAGILTAQVLCASQGQALTH